MNIREAISYRIEELCEQKQVKGYAVSNRIGMPASTFCCIMSGFSKNPGIVNINKIANGLGISIREFYDSDIFDHLEPMDR
ncbi:MAG: helix-turn-helix transcriptional regulator [Lachnospiraceae bacterium]|jgi:transcriptional regulator with XRE-family HTH domain|nr:helix-turn-helix transcriptional regulator [Lachnospiraceae bacterium]MCI8961104.1 helix-turn-helix transcriptional regulator [Lachnospiraceae bacterium]